MEYCIDVSDQAFGALKDHETDVLTLTRDADRPLREGDSLKLYHPSDPSEALIILIERMEIPTDSNCIERKIILEDTDCTERMDIPEDSDHKEKYKYNKKENDAELILHCSLLEWVFQIETEVDQLIREEEEFLSRFF